MKTIVELLFWNFKVTSLLPPYQDFQDRFSNENGGYAPLRPRQHQAGGEAQTHLMLTIILDSGTCFSDSCLLAGLGERHLLWTGGRCLFGPVFRGAPRSEAGLLLPGWNRPRKHERIWFVSFCPIYSIC